MRHANVLEAHPDICDVTDASATGDIVFTTAKGTWVLDFHSGADGGVFQDPTGTPAA